MLYSRQALFVGVEVRFLRADEVGGSHRLMDTGGMVCGVGGLEEVRLGGR